MKIVIGPVLVVIILGLAAVSAIAGAPSSWQVGTYWTYQQLEQAQSSPAVPMGTITYYVVARTDLLDTTICAVVRVDKSLEGKEMLSPLIVHVFQSGSIKPQIWPVPAPESPLTMLKLKGTMLGPGGSQTVKVVHPLNGKNSSQEFSIQQIGTEKITVPAGVFSNAVRFNYQEKISVPVSPPAKAQQSAGQYSWQAGGTAWWSSKVSGWVRIEWSGQESRPGGLTYTHATFVLSDWGRLSEKDLKAQLSAALTDISSVDPVMAVMIERQFQKVGLNLDNGG